MKALFFKGYELPDSKNKFPLGQNKVKKLTIEKTRIDRASSMWRFVMKNNSWWTLLTRTASVRLVQARIAICRSNL